MGAAGATRLLGRVDRPFAGGGQWLLLAHPPVLGGLHVMTEEVAVLWRPHPRPRHSRQ